MLKFLADENFPGDAIKVLSEKGYDIKWIGSFAAGSSDEEVLEIAMKELRILITFDKDFGELAFKRGLPAACGIILFRVPLLPPKFLVKIIEDAFVARNDWPGNFSVINMKQIRMRPIKNENN
jgi:predicted nuclease of predicted toxin-antitoxin system